MKLRHLFSGLLVGALLCTTATGSFSVPNGSITTAKLHDGAVTQAKRAALTYGISSSSGSYTTNSTTFTTVTNLTVTITTTGRPVFVGLQGSGSTSPTPAIFLQRNGTTAGFEGNMSILRDGGGLANFTWGLQFPSNGSLNTMRIPPSSVWMVDDSAVAGSHTYTVQVRVVNLGSVTDALGVTEAKLVAYEL